MSIPADGHTAAPATGGRCPMGEQFDPFAGDSAAWYAFMARARSDEPIFYSPILDYWVVTRFDDVMTVLRDQQTFSSANTLDPIKPLCPAALETMEQYGVKPGASLVNLDPPTHGVARQAYRKSFTPEKVEALEPRTVELVDRALDRIVQRGHADLVGDLMWDVPALIAFLFMGVPESEVDHVRSATARLATFGWGVPDDAEQVEVAKGLGEFWKLAEVQVDRMLDDPPEDNLIGDLIRHWRVPGNEDLFSRNELCWTFMNTVMAGHETTTNASAAGFRALLEHPAQWQALCAEPSLIPNAVEEILRYDSSVPAWRRVTTKRVRLGDVDLPDGAKLLIALGSANHDESRFADAERFDIRRERASDHIAFSWGRHACLGARLARMEMRVALERVTSRLPHLRLVPDQEWAYPPNTSHRGPEHVLVTWDPAENPRLADRPPASA